MLAEDTASVFPGSSSFRAKAGGPGGEVNGKLFFRDSLATIQIVELDLGRRCKPEVCAFQAKKIGGKLRQLAGSGERRAVHDERRKNLGVAVLAGVHIKKKVRKCALEARAPAFVDGETRSGDFGGGFEIQDSRALAH